MCTWRWSPIGIALALSCIALPIYAQAATPSQARARAISWLLEHQNSTGSWGSDPRLEQLTTATAVQAVRAAGVNVTQLRRAEAWLLNGAPTVTGDVSQTLLALATSELPVGTASVAAELSARQVHPLTGVFDFTDDRGRTVSHASVTLGEEVGWGIGPGQRANLADTATALHALFTAGAAIPNQVLAEQQLQLGWNGGWPLVKAISTAALPSWPVPSIPSSEVSTTAAVLIALGEIAAPGSPLLGIANNATAWLLGQQNPTDGGFGAGGVSSPAETALAYRALRAFGISAADSRMAAVIHPSGGYLLTLQDQNPASPNFGSWNGQAYTTALALHALQTSGIALDTDGDGTPDSLDANDDNDSAPDANDAFPLDSSETADLDHDGIGDVADSDRDADGFCDNPAEALAGGCRGIDLFPSDANSHSDLDGDSVADAADPDSDGDGILNLADRFPLNPSESGDLDRDGMGDIADSDRDGDGFCDNAAEALAGGCSGMDLYPDDPNEALDSDGDQIADNADLDDDQDGFVDADELVAGTDPLDPGSVPGPLNLQDDTDGDGLKNQFEGLLQSSQYRIDTDGDGATDRIEFDAGTSLLDATSQPRPVIAVMSGITPAPGAASEGTGFATTATGGQSTPVGDASGSGGGFANLAGFQPQTLLARDGDGDGLIGFEESAQRTSLTNVDTDGDRFVDGSDGVVDLSEVAGGFDLDGDSFVDGELDVSTDPTDPSDRPGKPGDVAPLGHPNGQVDIADVLVELRVVSDPSLAASLPGQAAGLTIEASDVNGDEETDSGDAVLLLKRVSDGE